VTWASNKSYAPGLAVFAPPDNIIVKGRETNYFDGKE
jgi:hypothetical protein